MASRGLREVAGDRGLLIGAAVNAKELGDSPAYRETVAREFNCVVAENAMKLRTLQPELVSRTYAGGVWTVVVKCPAAALGIAPGKAPAVEVQLERQRCRRGKEPARGYYWVPPMRPPWLAHFRFGRLQVQAK